MAKPIQAIAFVSTLAALLPATSWAGDVFSCKLKTGSLSGQIAVSETGRSSLALSDAKSGQPSVCSLRLRDFVVAERAEVPNVSFEFVVNPAGEACEPRLSPDLARELLGKITVIVELRPRGRRPEARMQWLRHEQVAPCAIGHFEKDELKIDADSWRQGAWGRSGKR